MQIDIDFEVFKALTALRQSESDSYNGVIRRLLGLSNSVGDPNSAAVQALLCHAAEETATAPSPSASQNYSARKGGIFGLASNRASPHNNALGALLGRYAGGLWLGNAHFPEGTQFRANYKGQTYLAEVRDGKWLDQNGNQRNSPSEAASAITGNNVNGWRFWSVQIPDDPTWRKLDEFKS
ncbi:MAG: hypothetical protein ACTHNA_04930 [Sphingopyxis terrae]|uniref:hypothetical protein n=1 Tax=Sphingopyxis terrae TaxID=33052 RepID=UPI003F80073A